MLIKICCLFHFLFPIWSPSLRCCLSGSPKQILQKVGTCSCKTQLKGSTSQQKWILEGHRKQQQRWLLGLRLQGGWALSADYCDKASNLEKEEGERGDHKVISPSPPHSNFWNTGRAFRSQQIRCPSATSRNEKGVIHTVTVQRMAGLGMAPSKTGDRPPHAIK